MDTYNPPLALTIVSGIFLALGALCFLVIVADIIWQKGWRSMMWIMIPVYPINATYMLPVTLFVYFKYGRPTKPTSSFEDTQPSCHSSSPAAPVEGQQSNDNERSGQDCEPQLQGVTHEDHQTQIEIPDSDLEKAQHDAADPHAHHDHGGDRPMWATVLVGVSHCGAGCVLGDLVGEWIVYGSGATINGHAIWAELLIDYAFALLFGIAFQYFSIAPMSGEYGPMSVWRAAKADILSLTSFEVGAFGWMIIYQVGIFDYRLGIATWTYWWMMQVGMAMGFATAMPVNYFLITKGIKEPCA